MLLLEPSTCGTFGLLVFCIFNLKNEKHEKIRKKNLLILNFYLINLPLALELGRAFSAPLPLFLRPRLFLAAPVRPRKARLVCAGLKTHEVFLSYMMTG